MFNAPELMSVEDMLTAIGLSGVLAYFFIPTIVFILVAYATRQYRRKRKLLRQQKKLMKKLRAEAVRQAKENAKIIKDPVKTMEALGNCPDKPINPERFRGLALEFDEQGKVKNK